ISDVANAEACFGASAPTTACPSTSYNYWLRPAFHPGTPNTITTEVAVVAAHLDDAYVSPFTWAGTNPTIAGAVPYSLNILYQIIRYHLFPTFYYSIVD